MKKFWIIIVILALAAGGLWLCSDWHMQSDDQSEEVPEVAQGIDTVPMLVTHILKHISTVGIGLRQCCDLARACHVLHHHYDVSMLLTACHHAHLDRCAPAVQNDLFRTAGFPCGA